METGGNEDARATFIVQVQFQQNESWQGTVSWSEGRQTRCFRSLLELVRLMDDALGGPQPDALLWKEETPHA